MVLRASVAVIVKIVAVATVEKVTAVGVKLNSGSVTGGLIPEYKHNTHHMEKINTVSMKTELEMH